MFEFKAEDIYDMKEMNHPLVRGTFKGQVKLGERLQAEDGSFIRVVSSQMFVGHPNQMVLGLYMEKEEAKTIIGKTLTLYPTYDRFCSEITAFVGEKFIIALPAMASAGYIWQMEEQDQEVITQSREHHIGEEQKLGAEPNELRVGGGGVQVFEYIGARSGSIQLRAVYKQPWVHDHNDEVIFTIHIIN
jgi:predicted secreted protein